METNTTLFPTYKQAILDLLKLRPEPGHIITREWLDEHFKLKKPSGVTTPEAMEKYQFDFMSAMIRFRNELLEDHKIALKTLHKTGGYQIISPGQQTKAGMTDFYKVIRKAFMDTRRTLLNVDLMKLNRDEVQENTEAQMRISMLAGMVRKSKKMGFTEKKLLGKDEQ